MIVGSIVYTSTQGLGILAKQFFDAGVVNSVCILQHHCRDNNFNWYPEGTPICKPGEGFAVAYEWLKTIDVFLVFETPFDWGLMTHARRLGKRVVLMPMYECSPINLPYEPDLFICPSELDYQYYPQTATRKSVYIPVPVTQKWSLREKAKVFVHNSGNGGLLGRNGTRELIDALPHIRSEATIVINTQSFDQSIHNVCAQWSSVVDVHYASGTANYDKLFSEGDVFVFPEKFNGLSLPLQEAYASGMLVMATRRFPNTEYLPTEPLIPIAGMKQNRVGGSYNWFEEAVIDPRVIAQTIDKWYDQDITDFSLRGKAYGQETSWEVLKPVYMEALSK